MTHPCWPLFDLRLRIADLELRPMTEADLTQLAAELPDDLEQDPAATTYDGVEPRVRRGIVVHQSYWKYYGSWRPEAWRLNFVVHNGGRLIGVQELEGNDFLTLRTVDTSSYLVADARGRGLGKRMRAAVLALAFGPLAAEAAITSAWHDNHASLGVSRSLGYRPNGESRMEREGGRGVDVLIHLLLKRDAWLAGDLGDGVEIEGFDPCRALFGLTVESRGGWRA
jgi:RimJ/RimL family protein N-acetyltransferase